MKAVDAQTANQPDKDAFMNKKPYNDNLVMASIKNLYDQATHSPASEATGLKRQNPDNLPIIGSLPVTITGQAARPDSSDLDDMVLTGLLAAVPAEPASPVRLTEAEAEAESQTDDDPFLAIRQAVISAGQTEQPDTQHTPVSSEQVKPAKQAFAGQLAELIDAEIERRLTERLNAQIKPASGQKRTAGPKQAKQAPKAKKQQKSAPQRKKTTAAKSVKKGTKQAAKQNTKQSRKPRRRPET